MQPIRQVGWQWRFYFDPLSAGGASEGNLPGMQKEAAISGRRRAIERIAGDRMPHACHVDTNLVRPSCTDDDFEIGEPSQFFQNLKARQR